MSDMKNALIEAARVYLFKNVHIPHKRFEVEMSEMLADFALSLLKWKSVADGLPEVDAIYPVIEREGNTRFYAYYIGRKEVWVTEDGADIVNVIAYIPVPIPEYVKEQR